MTTLFETDRIRGIAEEHSSDSKTTAAIGTVIDTWVKQHTQSESHPKVIIGRDTRPSGNHIEQELSKRLTSQGCKVTSSRIISTPATFHLTKKQKGKKQKAKIRARNCNISITQPSRTQRNQGVQQKRT